MIAKDDRQIPLPEPVERDVDDEDTFAPTRRLVRNFAALLAVGGLVGVVWYAYHAGVSAGSGGAVPVIRAEAGPIKEKVDQASAGGIDVPFRDRKVYDLVESGHDEAVKKSENAPKRAAVESGADGEDLDDDTAKAADTKPAGDKAADAKATDKKAEDKKAEDKKAEDKKAEDKKADEKKKAEEKVAAAAPSGFRIQLAAVSSAEDATRQWQRIQSKNMDLLGNLKLMVEKVDVPAKKQTLYRIQAGPFKSEQEAHDVCAKLAARKVSCFFVKA